MVEPLCKECGEELWPSGRFDTPGNMTYYSETKCENCGTWHEMEFELVDVIKNP